MTKNERKSDALFSPDLVNGVIPRQRSLLETLCVHLWSVYSSTNSEFPSMRRRLVGFL